MLRLDIGVELYVDMSAEARRWWPGTLDLEGGGRRDELEASGVLFRLPIKLLLAILRCKETEE